MASLRTDPITNLEIETPFLIPSTLLHWAKYCPLFLTPGIANRLGGIWLKGEDAVSLLLFFSCIWSEAWICFQSKPNLCSQPVCVGGAGKRKCVHLFLPGLKEWEKGVLGTHPFIWILGLSIKQIKMSTRGKTCIYPQMISMNERGGSRRNMLCVSLLWISPISRWQPYWFYGLPTSRLELAVCRKNF